MLSAWTNLTKIKKICSNLQIASTSLWYNKVLSKETMFLPNMYDKGVIMVSDAIDSKGNILESQKLKDHYQFESLNFLDYLRLKMTVRNFIDQHQFGEFNKIIGPIIPTNYWISKNNNTRGFYEILLASHNNEHISKGKWEKELQVTINHNIWKHVFQTCHRTIKDNKYKWF